ncbi:MAG: extracellular solute-binding protein [Clostridiales bacterium]|nr:extracellular solute-binding protein [Clostridiales bacterium]
MKKSIVSLFMISAMLTSLVSCGSEKSPTQNPQGEEFLTRPTKPNYYEEIEIYVDSIADRYDFSGETFTYIGRDDENFPANEDISGSVLSNAIYARQGELEEKFNIKWNYVVTESGDETQNTVIRDFEAGGSSYDLIYGSMLTVGQRLMVGSMLRDVDDFINLDLSKEWWIDSLNDTFRLKGHLYFLTGSIVLNNFQDASCVLYSKKLARENGIAGLYDLVINGEWTMDKMLESAAKVPVNQNGDGIYRYGHPSGVDWIFATGTKITSFTDSGIPYVEPVLTGAVKSIADKMSVELSDETKTAFLYSLNDYESEDPTEKYGVEDMRELFINDKILFWFDYTGSIVNFRDKNADIGVLPMPKGDRYQTQYYSYSNPWYGAAVYVPKNIKNADMTDAVTEAAAALSEKYVKPVFYDQMLKNDSAYDNESSAMIDIIFNTKIYDIIDIFSNGSPDTWGSYMSTLDYAVKTDSTMLPNFYEAYAKNTNEVIRTVMDSIPD